MNNQHTQEQLAALFIRVLARDDVQQQAGRLAAYVIGDMPHTQQAANRLASATVRSDAVRQAAHDLVMRLLNDPSIRATTGDALYDAAIHSITPSFVKSKSKTSKKSSKQAIDDTESENGKDPDDTPQDASTVASNDKVEATSNSATNTRALSNNETAETLETEEETKGKFACFFFSLLFFKNAKLTDFLLLLLNLVERNVQEILSAETGERPPDCDPFKRSIRDVRSMVIPRLVASSRANENDMSEVVGIFDENEDDDGPPR